MDKYAILNKTVVPLKLKPTYETEMADEGLYGMVCEILEDAGDGYYLVDMPYGYKAYINEKDIIMDDEKALKWKGEVNKVVMHHYVDIVGNASYKSYIVENLTRGAVVIATGKEEDNWSEVQLADGRLGWIRTAFLTDIISTFDLSKEADLRDAFVKTALMYMGTQYRWGGKSPLGIDCSGLCSIAYLLNGVTIYRDAKLKEEYILKEIPFAEVKRGDLLFFPGHVAMYMGDDKYVHSSSSINGVNINSLNPKHHDYREDLAKTLYAVGSIF